MPKNLAGRAAPAGALAATATRRRRLLHRGRLGSVAVMAAVAALALAAPAVAAPAGGTVGSPQPELAQFRVGPADGLGGGTALPDGTIVLASVSASSDSTINVCALHPGNRKCAYTVALHAHSGDAFYGTPQVLSTGATDVSVVAEDCCNIGGAVTFSSTDQGLTWSGENLAGNIQGVGVGTVADGLLVVANYTSGSFDVQAFAPSPGSEQMSSASPNSGEVGQSALTTYKGGVLVANDNLTNTYVEYAASGSNFNSSSSYKHIATFTKEDTFAISGNALLTDPNGSITGGSRLRFFNGTSFGKSYKVPDSKRGDDGYFALQEVRGTVHVFFEGRRNGYDLFEETTRNGVKWSRQQVYGTAIDSAEPVPVLGSTGAGIVFEADSGKPLAQPILNPQSVHIALQHAHVAAGHSTKLTGSVSPRLKNQLVTLEKLVHGRWYAVRTTHESAAGKFAFTVPGVTETYRAVVAYKPGYYEYGYSNSVTLRA
jgi:hypothetical protein